MFAHPVYVTRMLREVEKLEMPGGRMLTIFYETLEYSVGFYSPRVSSPGVRNIGRYLKVIQF